MGVEDTFWGRELVKEKGEEGIEKVKDEK